MYIFAIEVAKAGEENIKPEVTKEWIKTIISEFTQDWKYRIIYPRVFKTIAYA